MASFKLLGPDGWPWRCGRQLIYLVRYYSFIFIRYFSLGLLVCLCESNFFNKKWSSQNMQHRKRQQVIALKNDDSPQYPNQRGFRSINANRIHDWLSSLLETPTLRYSCTQIRHQNWINLVEVTYKLKLINTIFVLY